MSLNAGDTNLDFTTTLWWSDTEYSAILPEHESSSMFDQLEAFYPQDASIADTQSLFSSNPSNMIDIPIDPMTAPPSQDLLGPIRELRDIYQMNPMPRKRTKNVEVGSSKGPLLTPNLPPAGGPMMRDSLWMRRITTFPSPLTIELELDKSLDDTRIYPLSVNIYVYVLMISNEMFVVNAPGEKGVGTHNQARAIQSIDVAMCRLGHASKFTFLQV